MLLSSFPLYLALLLPETVSVSYVQRKLYVASLVRHTPFTGLFTITHSLIHSGRALIRSPAGLVTRSPSNYDKTWVIIITKTKEFVCLQTSWRNHDWNAVQKKNVSLSPQFGPQPCLWSVLLSTSQSGWGIVGQTIRGRQRPGCLIYRSKESIPDSHGQTYAQEVERKNHSPAKCFLIEENSKKKRSWNQRSYSNDCITRF